MNGGRNQYGLVSRPNHVVSLLQEHVWDASHYLVRLVFSSLKEMFTGTREIQVGWAHLHTISQDSQHYKITLVLY